MTNKEIGYNGELAAATYLKRKGYRIREKNFTVRGGEIDIIAEGTDGCTVFVEVKTRKSTSYGYASEFVNKNKRDLLLKTALRYCGEQYMRFDIVEVYYELVYGEMLIKEINHIEDILNV